MAPGPSGDRRTGCQQLEILQSASRLLKPGGRLVYATCSLLRQENEAVAQAFAAANPGFEALEAGELLAGQKVAGVESLCQGGDRGLQYLRLWPHRHGTDAFFASVWQKK